MYFLTTREKFSNGQHETRILVRVHRNDLVKLANVCHSTRSTPASTVKICLSRCKCDHTVARWAGSFKSLFANPSPTRFSRI